jgi:hypothetical protein
MTEEIMQIKFDVSDFDLANTQIRNTDLDKCSGLLVKTKNHWIVYNQTNPQHTLLNADFHHLTLHSKCQWTNNLSGPVLDFTEKLVSVGLPSTIYEY